MVISSGIENAVMSRHATAFMMLKDVEGLKVEVERLKGLKLKELLKKEKRKRKAEKRKSKEKQGKAGKAKAKEKQSFREYYKLVV